MTDPLITAIEGIIDAHTAPFHRKGSERSWAIANATSTLARAMTYNADDAAREHLRAIYRDLGAAIDEIADLNARAVADANERRAALLDQAEAS